MAIPHAGGLITGNGDSVTKEGAGMANGLATLAEGAIHGPSRTEPGGTPNSKLVNCLLLVLSV